jgi:pyridoxine kinase
MNILSIQSEVVYGHVGNRAARFAFERLGIEAWTVPTILLSSHAGYTRVEGEATSADLMRRLIDGLDGNGWLGNCDAVLSGYLGHADQADVVADAVGRVKAANPRTLLPRSRVRRWGPHLCEAWCGGRNGAVASAAGGHRHAECL